MPKTLFCVRSSNPRLFIFTRSRKVCNEFWKSDKTNMYLFMTYCRYCRLLLITYFGLKSVTMKNEKALSILSHDGTRFSVDSVSDGEAFFSFLYEFAREVNRVICEVSQRISLCYACNNSFIFNRQRLKSNKKMIPCLINGSTIKWQISPVKVFLVIILINVISVLF